MTKIHYNFSKDFIQARAEHEDCMLADDEMTVNYTVAAVDDKSCTVETFDHNDALYFARELELPFQRIE